MLKKVEKPDEGIWHRGPIVIDVIAYVMMVLGTILWLVEDKDNEILKVECLCRGPTLAQKMTMPRMRCRC